MVKHYELFEFGTWYEAEFKSSLSHHQIQVDFFQVDFLHITLSWRMFVFIVFNVISIFIVQIASLWLWLELWHISIHLNSKPNQGTTRSTLSSISLSLSLSLNLNTNLHIHTRWIQVTPGVTLQELCIF